MYQKRKNYWVRMKRSKYENSGFLSFDTSTIFEYFRENIYVCIIAYVVLYAGIYYVNKIIQRIEEMNQQLWNTVQKNKVHLDDVVFLKTKREEYENAILEKKRQNDSMVNLESETKRMTGELALAESKVNELEETLAKLMPTEDVIAKQLSEISEADDEFTKGSNNTKSYDDMKVLEPSFPPPEPSPPPQPPQILQPPQRQKYGLYSKSPRQIAISASFSPGKVGIK